MRSAGILVLLVGCYSPAAYRDCEVSCEQSGACPAGFTCGLTDRRCHAEGSTTCPFDASVIESCVTGSLFPAPYCPSRIEPMVTLSNGGSASTEDMNCMDVVAQNGGTELCIYAVADVVRLTAGFTFKGARPVAIVALKQIIVEANLDVANGGAGDLPTKTDIPGCDVGPADLALSGVTGSAGGGGGGFMGKGGTGGPVIGGTSTPGGTALEAPTIVRTGCPGGNGGGNDLGLNRSRGGRPGGGIYLLAGESINVRADIYAYGGGGSGTPTASLGGGGGGSGGMIVVEAPMVVIGSGAKLLAAGGGGAEGGGPAGTSMDGGVQTAVSPMTPAPGGGMGVGPAGGKGSGASMVLMGGQSATSASGGGGGGGAAGYIRVVGALTNLGVIVPPLTP